MQRRVLLAVDSLEKYLVRIELLTIAVAFLAMLGISLIEIIGRNVFHAGIPGGEIFLRQSVLWVAFPGAVLAVVTQRHIRLDPLALAQSSTWMRWTYRPYHFISALVCALFALAAARFWWDDWRNAPADGLWVSALSIILPACFLLMALHFFLRVIAGPKPDAQT